MRPIWLAGFIPLPWFLLWTSLAGAMAPGYSALSQQASELTLLAGLPHVMLDVAAIGSGIAFMIFALGLWIESGRRIAFGALGWMLFGVAMVSNGLWAMGSPMHGLYGLGLVTLIAPGLAMIETQRLRDSQLAYTVTVLVSIAGFVYLWMNLTGSDPRHWKGLTQRIFSSINSLWPAVMAYLFLYARPMDARSGKPASDSVSSMRS